MLILDTNVISELVRPEPDAAVLRWLRGVSESVAITSITLAELVAGLELMPAGHRRDDLTSALRHAVEPYRGTNAILAFDDAAAERYGEVLGARRSAGLPISTADAQIASICRAHSATLTTRNVRDFVGTGIPVVNPWNGERYE